MDVLLSRTHTAPTFPPTRARTYSNASPPQAMTSHPNNASNPHFSTYSQPSSLRSSDSTQATSNSTLFGAVPPLPTNIPVSNTPVLADQNVLNKRADKEASLFQMCMTLLARLKTVPGFQDYIDDVNKEPSENWDPVSLLWRVFRNGYPLLLIYNTWKPELQIHVDEKKVQEKQRAKHAAFKFMSVVFNDLNIAEEDKFILGDLFQDDTTGFVKVVKIVGRLLDQLVLEGRIEPLELTSQSAGLAPGVKRTHRQHIVEELINTERTYVQHLEILQDFRKLIDHNGIISGDAAHQIFLNLGTLLDFQRRFLIRLEGVNEQPEDQQDWGQPFIINKDAFLVYEPYIANQKACEKIVVQEFARIQERVRQYATSSEVLGMVEGQTVLSAFLLKPFQRLTKYPLLLKDLMNKGDVTEAQKVGISEGIRVAEMVLTKANDAVAREDRAEAVEELRERVDDWKGHKLENFGELLLYGTFQVIKGEAGGSKDSEREVSAHPTPEKFSNLLKSCAHLSGQYKIYLFDMILLCCKELDPRKQKVTARGRNALDRKGRPKLQLKGRIFMQNVTDTIMSSKTGHYTCQIFWKGDPSIEYFTIRFTTEDMMRKWAQQVVVKLRNNDSLRNSNMSRSTGASLTDFQAMNSLGPTPVNPHIGRDDDDEEDPPTSISSAHEFPYGRTDSDISQRSRSTTNDSTMSRHQYARAQAGGPNAPLTIRTGELGQAPDAPSDGPQQWASDSYFSPVTETPATASIRGSMQSGSFPFPSQQYMSGRVPDHSARYTAPAVPRQQSREPSLNGYPPQVRGAGRPSLPPHAASAQATFTQNRMRSASSPDIQGAPQRHTVQPSMQNGVPDLPALPQNFAYGPGVLGRMQTASPAINMAMRATPPNAMAGRPIHPRSTPLTVHQEYPHHGGPSHAPSLSRDMHSSNRPTTPSGHHYSNSASSAQYRTSPPKQQTHQQAVYGHSQIPSLSHNGSSAPAALDNMAQQSPQQSHRANYKVRVVCQVLGTSFAYIIPEDVTYETLRNRIDSKFQKISTMSLSSGQLRLKYNDDGDFVTIASDEDVLECIESWVENPKGDEIMLFCQAVGGE